jgi:hypothetical protein
MPRALDRRASQPLTLGHGGRHLLHESCHFSSEFRLVVSDQDLADRPPGAPNVIAFKMRLDGPGQISVPSQGQYTGSNPVAIAFIINGLRL